MSDPLAQIIDLLRPCAASSKLVVAAGQWAVHRQGNERLFYCAVLEGSCRFEVVGEKAVVVRAGDFVLVPEACDFTTTSLEPPAPNHPTSRRQVVPGTFHIGELEVEPDVRVLIGHCTFVSDDAPLLVSLLPRFVHARNERRLVTLVELLNDETRADRPGREIVLARLLEVLLIEAFRSEGGASSPPGLIRGLADERLSVALRAMHDRPTEAWTIDHLAKRAGLSRSTFFDRFRREVGATPMEYLLGWRMALAKSLLRQGSLRLAQVAERVGYSSASTFSVAFARHSGTPPIIYARAERRGRSTAGSHES